MEKYSPLDLSYESRIELGSLVSFRFSCPSTGRYLAINEIDSESIPTCICGVRDPFFDQETKKWVFHASSALDGLMYKDGIRLKHQVVPYISRPDGVTFFYGAKAATDLARMKNQLPKEADGAHTFFHKIEFNCGTIYRKNVGKDELNDLPIIFLSTERSKTEIQDYMVDCIYEQDSSEDIAKLKGISRKRFIARKANLMAPLLDREFKKIDFFIHSIQINEDDKQLLDVCWVRNTARVTTLKQQLPPNIDIRYPFDLSATTSATL